MRAVDEGVASSRIAVLVVAVLVFVYGHKLIVDVELYAFAVPIHAPCVEVRLPFAVEACPIGKWLCARIPHVCPHSVGQEDLAAHVLIGMAGEEDVGVVVAVAVFDSDIVGGTGRQPVMRHGGATMTGAGKGNTVITNLCHLNMQHLVAGLTHACGGRRGRNLVCSGQTLQGGTSHEAVREDF